MSMRVTPQMLNTMDERDLWSDPLRRYLLPAAEDREPVWHTHPHARRDSLKEAEMSIVEGLVMRYPTKVLLELTTTCPVYCGHCTRMDLVGPHTPAVRKRRMPVGTPSAISHQLDRLASMRSVRDVVLSGGDLVNVPLDVLEICIDRLLQFDHIRSIRLATKAMCALPQYFLQASTQRCMERLGRAARRVSVELALHTHINHVRSVTPLVVEAAKNLRELGIDALRNQAVLLRHVNDSAVDVLDLSFTLLDEAQITPYYFYMCDLIPHAEHWRLTLAEAQSIQEQIMGYLPGFATPRVVCDVPGVGKCWVHQARSYDRVLGVSSWSKSYPTSVDAKDDSEFDTSYRYFDPVSRLPLEGQAYWTRAVSAVVAG